MSSIWLHKRVDSEGRMVITRGETVRSGSTWATRVVLTIAAVGARSLTKDAAACWLSRGAQPEASTASEGGSHG